ncbi:MAG: NAD-dependent epimerase/dehydratase family protein [Thermodesulfobacteriota bacterium]
MLEAFTNASILVVGGAGFVGSNLVRKLLTFDPRKVLVVDNLMSADKKNLPESDKLTFIEGSITDDRVLARVKDEHEYVFHLATYHGNQSSIHDPLADHENNTYTTLKLCERIRDFKKIKKVVYSSAGCTVAEKTFDTAKATQEEAPVSLYLDSPYQISKIIGEFYFNYYFRQYGMPVVKARFQNVYGPGEILGAGQWRGTPATVWRNVTPTFVYRALKHMPLTLENEGIATRDFIYVTDIVDGLLACAAKGGRGEVYNLASGVETSIRELADTINRLAKNPTPAKLLPKRAWDHSGKRFGATEKAQKELGFQAKMGLEQGLTETIAWTEKNLGLIEACMAAHKDKMPGGIIG